MKKVVDCFPFFNEVELLELRIRMLEPYVDLFVISEANRTHSGNHKEFNLKRLINELNLPAEKIKVLEVDLYSEKAQTPSYIDICHATSAKSEKDAIYWTRERIQRDALADIIDEFDDETVFIMSDCDEIIDPTAIEFLTSIARQNPHIVIRVPLMLFESRADLQVVDSLDKPVIWDESMFLAMKHHIKETQITLLKANQVPNEFSPWHGRFIMQNGKRIDNLGWHFTWMGDKERKLYKSQSFIHHSNLDVVNNVSKNTIEFLSKNLDRPIEVDKEFKLKKIDHSLLPKQIFDYPHIRKFLLGENEEGTIINYFPYTGKKELLDLRIKILYDKIDLFYINDKDGSCQTALNFLGIPRDKIRINEEIPDNCFCYVTDEDEILNPLYIDYYVSMIKKSSEIVIRVPLSTNAATDQNRDSFLANSNLIKKHTFDKLRTTTYTGVQQAVIIDNGVVEPVGWKLTNYINYQKIEWPKIILNTPKFKDLFLKYGYLQ
jgi:hypothetical protein